MKSAALIFVVSFPAVGFGAILRTAHWPALGPCRKKGGDSWKLQTMGVGSLSAYLHISGTRPIIFNHLSPVQGILTGSWALPVELFTPKAEADAHVIKSEEKQINKQKKRTEVHMWEEIAAKC